MSADLSQAQVTQLLAATCAVLPEHRRGCNCIYTLANGAWAAFRVFFSQAPSFRAGHCAASWPKARANAANWFGATKTPCDPQIRNLLDPLTPEYFYALFATILPRFKAGGYLRPYQAFADNLNAWATDQHLSQATLHRFVQTARSHWKYENAGHNVLKHQGYHLEHNFGHGACYLAQVLLLLNLFAFLMHTALALCAEIYQAVRTNLATRSTFFDDEEQHQPRL